MKRTPSEIPFGQDLVLGTDGWLMAKGEEGCGVGVGLNQLKPEMTAVLFLLHDLRKMVKRLEKITREVRG